MSNSTQNDWEKKAEDWFVDVVEYDNSEYSYTAKFNSLLALIEEVRADARKEVKNDYDNRMFTIDSLKRTCKHCGVIRGVKLHEDTDSHDRYQIGYNKAIDDVLATLREEGV